MRGLVKLIFWLCGGLVATGQENVPLTGRLLLCPNHISDSDPAAVLAMLPRNDFAAMAKDELFRVPLLGWLLRAYGTFPVVRESADRKSLRQAEAILERERALMIFPEGRLSEDGKLLRLQSGAALLALRTGSPIVPVGLIGTNRVLPYAKLIPRPAGKAVQVRYGKPILMDEFTGAPHKEAIRQITRRLAEELARLTDQPVPEDSAVPATTSESED
ncbi:MAG TPA: lysophospholipid acyltransferase family protein [Capsulimonadaceae bacterium]|nr:lysophospholipid acyltransferase family protein [Capsulimonadaceae bacterium]